MRPAGSRGGIAIRHYFPVDGEYLVRVRLQRDGLGAIIGIAEQRQIDVRIDGARIKLFSIGGERKGKFLRFGAARIVDDAAIGDGERAVEAGSASALSPQGWRFGKRTGCGRLWLTF